MSLLGFTFGFGARDEGMSQAMGNANRSLNALNSLLDDSNRQAARRGGVRDLFDSLQSLQLNSIQNALESLTGGAEIVTTGLEATFTSMTNEARPFVAQMGLVGAEAAAARSEIAGLAHSLNVGAGEVARAFQSMEVGGQNATDALSSIGIGLRELVIAERTTGIQTNQLVETIAGLTNGLGFTSDAAGEFLDTFTATAVQAGQGAVAFSSLDTALSQLDQTLQSSQRFRDLSLEDQQRFVQQTILGTQRLAGALTEVLGVAPQQAQDSANAFANALLENASSIEGMFAGAGGEFTSLMQSVSRESGLDLSAQILGGTPDEAMAGLIQFRTELQRLGQNDAVQRLDIALRELEPGLSFGFLADSGERAIEVMRGLQVSSDDATGSLRRLAEEGFSTGRTLDEQLSLIRDGFITNMGRIGGGTGQYVRAQRDAYRELTATIEGLGSDETWGPLMRRFALATRVGMSAFFMPMRRNSEQTAAMFEQLSAGIGEGGIAGRFEAIRQLGVAGLFLDLGDASRDMASAVDAAQEKAGELYTQLLGLKIAGETFAPVLGGLVASLVGLKVASTLVTGGLGTVFSLTRLLAGPFLALGSAVLGATTAVAGVLGWPLLIAGAVAAIVVGVSALPEEVQAKIAEFVDVITGGVNRAVEYLSNIDGTALADGFIAMLSSLPERISTFFQGLFDDTAQTASGPLGQAVMALGGSLVNLFGQLFRVGGEFFSRISDQVVTFVSGLFEGVTPASLGASASEFASSVGTSISNAFQSLFDPDSEVGGFLSNLPERFLDAMVQLGPMIERGGAWLQSLGDSIVTAIRDFDLAGAIDAFFEGLFNPTNVNASVSGIDWDSILQGIMGALFNIGRAVFYVTQFSFQVITALGAAILQGAFALSANLVEMFGLALGAGYEATVGLFSQLGSNLYQTLAEALRPLATVFEPFVEGARTVFSFFGGILDSLVIEPFRRVYALLTGELSIGEALQAALLRPLQLVYRLTQPLVQGVLTTMNAMIVGIASFVNDAIGLYNRAAQFVPGLEQMSLIDLSAIQLRLPEFNMELPDTVAAGESIVGGVAEGMLDNSGSMRNAAESAADLVMAMLPQSPPRDPSSPFHALPNAGYSIMQSIAQGMDSGLVLVSEVVTSAYELIQFQLSQLATAFSDMFSIQSAFGQNIRLIGDDIAMSFERIGGQASAAFARGLIETQRDRLTQVQRDLATLFTDVYQNVRIENVTEAGDSVTLSVDSVRSITDSIRDMKDAVVTRLDSISENTRQTAVNTSMRTGGATVYASGV